jgi:hypothetical protein
MMDLFRMIYNPINMGLAKPVESIANMREKRKIT